MGSFKYNYCKQTPCHINAETIDGAALLTQYLHHPVQKKNYTHNAVPYIKRKW